MPEYRATEYLRLSYSMDRENESDSITNQKKLIEDFLKGLQRNPVRPAPVPGHDAGHTGGEN